TLLESDVRGPLNIGSGEAVTLRQIVERLGAIAGRADLLEIGAIPPAPTDAPLVVADVTRLKTEGVEATVFDMRAHIGGHTASYQHATGFTFDEGPHISFTKDPRIKALFAAN